MTQLRRRFDRLYRQQSMLEADKQRHAALRELLDGESEAGSAGDAAGGRSGRGVLPTIDDFIAQFDGCDDDLIAQLIVPSGGRAGLSMSTRSLSSPPPFADGSSAVGSNATTDDAPPSPSAASPRRLTKVELYHRPVLEAERTIVVLPTRPPAATTTPARDSRAASRSRRSLGSSTGSRSSRGPTSRS